MCKSETTVRRGSRTPHDPAGGVSLPRLDPHTPALDQGRGPRRSSDARRPPPHRPARVPALLARSGPSRLSGRARGEDSACCSLDDEPLVVTAAARLAGRRVRDRDGDRRLRGARQGRDVPSGADHSRRSCCAGLDGIEACRCLRRLPETREVRILGVTGHPSMVPVLLGRRGGRVRDQATGPGPGVPRDQAAALGACGLPTPSRDERG